MVRPDQRAHSGVRTGALYADWANPALARSSVVPDAGGGSGEAASSALPAPYWRWLAGTGLSLVGTQTLAFAMAWTAAADSALLAGLVLTLVNLPRAALLLVGGAAGDRLGAWRVLVVCDATMLAATLGLTLVLALRGPSGSQRPEGAIISSASRPAGDFRVRGRAHYVPRGRAKQGLERSLAASSTEGESPYISGTLRCLSGHW